MEEVQDKSRKREEIGKRQGARVLGSGGQGPPREAIKRKMTLQKVEEKGLGKKKKVEGPSLLTP